MPKLKAQDLSLIINAGSSSLRFSVFNNKEELELEGHADAIGRKNARFIVKQKSEKLEEEWEIKNHEQAVKGMLHFLKIKLGKEKVDHIKKVGHRVVHGGEFFREPVLITSKVLEKIDALSELAPQHNPVSLKVIKAAQKWLKSPEHFAIFDTGFHSTLPERAYLYGLPYKLYKEKGIRRYGFHGESHKYVSLEAAKKLKKKAPRIITCHMGNGVSMAAIEKGVCLDTTMGYTPLEGPPMGSRSGSMDPKIPLKLVAESSASTLEKKLEQVSHLLEKESGLLGLSGIGTDVRTLHEMEHKEEVQRTFKVYSYQIAKHILGLCAALSGPPHAIVFTAGVGENAFYLRRIILNELSGALGIKWSEKKNAENAATLSTRLSKTKVFIIPTNEALQMHRDIN